MIRYQVVSLQIISIQSKVVSLQSKVVSLQPLSQFATSMNLNTNLKYCINSFACNPHMCEPNSFAIIDEYMSNVVLLCEK